MPKLLKDWVVYYAHSRMVYNTKRETNARSYLETLHKKVICPNRDIGERKSIVPYLAEIVFCDAVVCTEFEKHIGKGVFDEVKFTLLIKKPVFVLRGTPNHPTLTKVKDIRGVNDLDWKVKYGRLLC